MLYKNIKKLVEYGVQTGLIPECERMYTTNLILEILQEDAYEDVDIQGEELELEEILKGKDYVFHLAAKVSVPFFKVSEPPPFTAIRYDADAEVAVVESVFPFRSRTTLLP